MEGSWTPVKPAVSSHLFIQDHINLASYSLRNSTEGIYPNTDMDHGIGILLVHRPAYLCGGDDPGHGLRLVSYVLLQLKHYVQAVNV